MAPKTPTEDNPFGFTEADHLAAIAAWGPDYAAGRQFGRQEVFPAPVEESVSTVSHDDIYASYDMSKFHTQEYELLPDLKDWNGGAGWPCMTNEWVQRLPPPEEWSNVDEPTPFPKLLELDEVVTFDSTFFYTNYPPNFWNFTVVKRGRIQSDATMSTATTASSSD